jgi:hypothetical protein
MTVNHRSKQEETLRILHPDIPYEKGRFHYTITAEYIPDFWLGGNIYVECKEFINYADVRKYEAIAASNPTLDLRFLVGRCGQTTLDRLEKTFKVAKGGYIIPAEWIREGLLQGGTNV